MRLVNEATRQLRGKGNKQDPAYDALKAQLVSLRKVLGQVKAGEILRVFRVCNV